MLTRLAVEGYRSIRKLAVDLGPLNIITGANGSGKSSLYRSLRLLADVAQGRLLDSIAKDGGIHSILWAGPEKLSHSMRSGEHPVQGTLRRDPIALRLGFSSQDYGYAVDLGLPQPGSAFSDDPEIKLEAMWIGEKLRPSALVADRRGPSIRLRSPDHGDWQQKMNNLATFDSMMGFCADIDDGMDLLRLRERMRGWRFYDSLRTDAGAPARQPQVATYTPVLAADGSDLSAAIATIQAIGDAAGLDETIDDAFAGARVHGHSHGYGTISLAQHGLLRPLTAAELSDGTLRFLMLSAALLSPRPPEFIALNEPETSLHPSLIIPLARLLRRAVSATQIMVVTHNAALIEALSSSDICTVIALEKSMSETCLVDGLGAPWTWPER